MIVGTQSSAHPWGAPHSFRTGGCTIEYKSFHTSEITYDGEREAGCRNHKARAKLGSMSESLETLDVLIDSVNKDVMMALEGSTK
jgi:hypothetical protein